MGKGTACGALHLQGTLKAFGKLVDDQPPNVQ